MTDLSDLAGSVRGIRDRALRWNAVDGQGWRIEIYNPETGDRDFELLPEGLTWICDMATRRRGAIKTGEGVFDVRLSPVGSPLPDIPANDDDFKPGVAMVVWHPEYGVAEITTASTVVRDRIVYLWEVVKARPEAATGAIPAVRFGPPVEVSFGGKRNLRVFYAPTFELHGGWADRSEVPGICFRPATVPPPKPAKLQIEDLSARPKKHLKPAMTAGAALNDEIPY
jgi:hypothetical protein